MTHYTNDIMKSATYTTMKKLFQIFAIAAFASLLSGCIVTPANSPGYAQRPYGQPYAPPPNGQPLTPPNVAPPAADELDFGYYQTQLGPYGDWVDIPDNGQCWVPTEVKVNPAWRPYVDNGKWDYTDQGWYWTSEYPWGEIVFHYGRWISHPQYHWAWVPGFDWAPAWVTWRDDQSDGAVAWAPLPPAAQFQAGVGLEYDGQPADTVDVDFGLAPAAFVFVGYDQFWAFNPRPLVIAPEQVSLFYSRSAVRNNYAVVGGKLRVEGLGGNRMAGLTHRQISIVSAQRLKINEETLNANVRQKQHPGVGMRPPVPNVRPGPPGTPRPGPNNNNPPKRPVLGPNGNNPNNPPGRGNNPNLPSGRSNNPNYQPGRGGNYPATPPKGTPPNQQPQKGKTQPAKNNQNDKDQNKN